MTRPEYGTGRHEDYLTWQEEQRANRRQVECEDNCGAYDEPDQDNLEELRAALEHWREHGLTAGCSHAR